MIKKKALSDHYSRYFSNSSLIIEAVSWFEHRQAMTMQVAGREYTSSFVKDLDKFERHIRTRINQVKQELRQADKEKLNGRYWTQPVTSSIPLAQDLEFCQALKQQWKRLERWAEDEDNEGVAYLDMDSRHPYTQELKSHITYLTLKGDYANG